MTSTPRTLDACSASGGAGSRTARDPVPWLDGCPRHPTAPPRRLARGGADLRGRARHRNGLVRDAGAVVGRVGRAPPCGAAARGGARRSGRRLARGRVDIVPALLSRRRRALRLRRRRARGGAASDARCSTGSSPTRPATGSGRSRRRSSPGTRRASRSMPPPAFARSAGASASPSGTGAGRTRCSSSCGCREPSVGVRHVSASSRRLRTGPDRTRGGRVHARARSGAENEACGTTGAHSARFLLTDPGV